MTETHALQVPFACSLGVKAWPIDLLACGMLCNGLDQQNHLLFHTFSCTCCCACTCCCFSEVYSHPFFPDVHAMVCVLYEDQWKESPEARDGKVFPHRIAAAKAALAKAQAAKAQAV